MPAVPVHHRHQIHEPTRHRHVGDIAAPHLVGACDRQIPQKVRENPVFWAGDAGPRSWINRLDAHRAQEPLHAFAVDDFALRAEPSGHVPRAVKGRPEILLVDHPHHPQIVGLADERCVVAGRARQAEQFALLADAQFGMVGFDPFAQFLS